jgi:hypothetical protein
MSEVLHFRLSLQYVKPKELEIMSNKVSILIDKIPNKENAFWYFNEVIAMMKLPNGNQLALESRGSIRLGFIVDDNEDEMWLSGEQAVDEAIFRNYTDKDINNEDIVAWDMNNWFAVVEINTDNEVCSDDLAIAHDYDEGIEHLNGIYNEYTK